MSHYDLGNAFYSLWLDESMTYSGALFAGDENRTLEEAQQAKYNRILSKLKAAPGSHILEIGCGWGGFAEAAAKQGYRVTAVTISPEQAEFARQRMIEQGLNHLVTIVLKDYREMEGAFDFIVSIGMFEHVGQEYWPAYFKTVHDRLKPGGKAVIQSITLDDAIFERSHGVTGFIEHYIFPGGLLPSRSRFKEAAEKAGLECKEQFAFGMDYARTLREWRRRFEAHLPQVRALGFDETFIRLWRFYLSICIGSFESKRSSLMQAELVR
jgi:cyclopropane-fatty-acyl-phospholipid synthase